MKTLAHSVLLAFIVTVASPVALGDLAWAAKDSFNNIKRVVAIGDLHGDYEGFLEILENADLIDDDGDWIGGRSNYVQLGDIVDRGPDSLLIIDHLTKLERQAKRARGRVHILLGNHEIMNFTNDRRYVSEGEYEALLTDTSEEDHEQYYKNFVAWIKENRPEEDWPAFDEDYRAEWDELYPLGTVEHMRNWAPTGKLGKWVLSKNAVLRIDDTLFVHGGVGPTFADASFSKINKQVRKAMKGDRFAEGTILDHEDGPFWYRGFARNSGPEEEALLAHVLDVNDVKRIVIAHSPNYPEIRSRFDGRVILVDIGISNFYRGTRGFLEITPDAIRANSDGEYHAVEPADDDGGEAIDD